MKLADAAEKVLQDKREPIHYKDLAYEILNRKLATSASVDPGTTLHAVISIENRSRQAREQTPRFVIQRGMVSLREWAETKQESDVKTQLNKVRESVKRELIRRLIDLGGEQFPYFVASLLEATGDYTDIEVTDGPDDEGIDIVCESQFGINRLKTAVQAKCMGTNRAVGPNAVRLLRDVLPNHGCAQGVILTTTRFDPRAIEAASEPNKPTILLVPGDALAELALEHGVGVKVDYLPLYSIADDFWQPSSSETA